VVTQQELSPGPVAERCCPLAGADDVREEDRGQHPVGFNLGMRAPDDVSKEALQLGEQRLLLAE
jgi:hypothetical protein